jgi:hypothetical protein
MVRCHLDGSEDNPARDLRFIPAAEFDLWRHFMETRHVRMVTVDEVSIWMPDTLELLEDEIDADAMEPVLRVRFEKPRGEGLSVPVERFFPTETYPEAKDALLAHFDPRCRESVQATPGYFVASASRSQPEPAPEG